MELQMLTALLTFCLCLTLSLGLGEDEDEVLLHSFNAPVRGLKYIPESCMVPYAGLSAFGYAEPEKQLELKLGFQPQRQMLHSSGDGAERLLRYGAKSQVCPVVSSKEAHSEELAPTMSMASEEDYDDNDDASDEDDSDDDDVDEDDDAKEFTARVSCLLRTLYKSTKCLSKDLKALDSALLPQLSSASAKLSYQANSKSSKKSRLKQRPNYIGHSIVRQDDYSDPQHSDARTAASDQIGLKLKRVSSRQQSPGKQELSPQAVSVAKNPIQKIIEERLLQSQPVARGGTFKFVQVPFVASPTRIIVPPLLQLLSRRSALPWSMGGPNMIHSRRYLHALSELRLARAVQAATAARYRQQKSNVELQQHVDAFKENLRRLVSNRAAIERRVSGLLTGISHDVNA